MRPASSPCPDAPAERVRWFTEEVWTHEPKLKNYLRSAFPGVRDIEDVVQEAYLRVWRAQATQRIRLAKTFLYTVARRIALDWVRRERRSPFVAVKNPEQLFVLDPAGDAATAAETSMQLELLAEAVASLPPRCREIFLQCHVEGSGQAEVARRLGLSINTVAVQSARGLRRCDAFIRCRLAQL